MSFRKLDRQGTEIMKTKNTNRPINPGTALNRPPEAHLQTFKRYQNDEIEKGTAIRLIGGYGPYYKLLKWLSKQHVQKPPGRNAPCPCGSGNKFKKCCLTNVVKTVQNQRITK